MDNKVIFFSGRIGVMEGNYLQEVEKYTIFQYKGQFL